MSIHSFIVKHKQDQCPDNVRLVLGFSTFQKHTILSSVDSSPSQRIRVENLRLPNIVGDGNVLKTFGRLSGSINRHGSLIGSSQGMSACSSRSAGRSAASQSAARAPGEAKAEDVRGTLELQGVPSASNRPKTTGTQLTGSSAGVTRWRTRSLLESMARLADGWARSLKGIHRRTRS